MKIKKSGQLKSFDPIKRDGWDIKMSVLNDHYILTILRSESTGQTAIRYFNNEQEAAEFVEFVCEMDATEEQDI